VTTRPVNNRKSRNDVDGRLLFISQFFRHPMQVASLVPSSRFLMSRVLAAAAVERAGLVVELGPGTGGTTRAILGALPPDGRLLSIELNPRLHRLVQAIPDRRLIAHRGSACELSAVLAAHGFGAADAVVSGIPFSTMPRIVGARTAAAIAECLAADGRFVAYQASARVAELCRPHLGTPRVDTELLNIPPMRVFRWERTGG
jgi:phosphatidylethanolamine/phosphatidyl-N-methylethanolamine N-methyltransferase